MDLESERRLSIVAEQESRAELSAESFSPRMRVGLLLVTLLGESLLAFFVIAAGLWPNGLLDVSPFLGAYIGGILIGFLFYLMVIYGGLVGHNTRIEPGGHMAWLLSFVVFGPIALPAYWFMHVWPAPYEPWVDTPPEFSPARTPA